MVEDKRDGYDVDAAEYRRLKKLQGSVKHDRSRCLDCGHQLVWYDLIPFASWLSTGGRCRYCKRLIGKTEILLEVGMAALFVASYLWWPYGFGEPITIGLYPVFLLLTVPLAILFVYDLKWFLLPEVINYSFIALAAIMAAGGLWLGNSWLNLLGSLTVLPGLYALLYYYSRWRNGEEATWVGFGDVTLSIGLALLLGSWQLALVALVTANLIGTAIVLPGLVTGRLGRHARMPFGPLLVAGTLLAFFWGTWLIDWYTRTIITL